MHKQKKACHKYIKENIKSGYTLLQIKKALVDYGYSEEFAESLLKEHKAKKVLIAAVPLLFIFALIVYPFVFDSKSITTLATVAKNNNFTDNINIRFSQNANYSWNLENKGILKSLRISGNIKKNGSARVYLEHENQRYLVFDSRKLDAEHMLGITGLTLEIDNIDIESEGNLTQEKKQILEDLIFDINHTKNSISIEIEAEENEITTEITGSITEYQQSLISSFMNGLNESSEKIKVKIESEFEEKNPVNDGLENDVAGDSQGNETAEIPPISQDNETTAITPINPANETINATPIIPANGTIANETAANATFINDSDAAKEDISLSLSYKGGSPFDPEDDGIEGIYGIVDLTVNGTELNFDGKEENLCTLWTVDSLDGLGSSSVCYGGSRCCNFADFEPINSDWKETFYSSYGKHGASFDNIIFAQVLYADYNLSPENPYLVIYSSDIKNITARFYNDFIPFSGVCLESCILSNLNSSSYKLIFEINNSEISVDSIDYEASTEEKVNSPPILLKNFTKIEMYKDESYEINLGDYFYDEDNDSLAYSYYNGSNIKVEIRNDTAVLASAGFEGTTYMFFIANDSVSTELSNVFEVQVNERELLDLSGLKSLRKIVSTLG